METFPDWSDLLRLFNAFGVDLAAGVNPQEAQPRRHASLNARTVNPRPSATRRVAAV
jgi:hypothetical protein